MISRKEEAYDILIFNTLYQLISIFEEKVSPSRQNIARFLKGHQPFIHLIRDGIYHLSSVILDPGFEIKKKYKLEKLFRRANYFLQIFCRQNEKNQIVLYQEKEIYINYAHLDVGQIDVLCEIFKDNRTLCLDINEAFVKKLINLIEKEGRQAIFLKFLLVMFEKILD